MGQLQVRKPAFLAVLYDQPYDTESMSVFKSVKLKGSTGFMFSVCVCLCVCVSVCLSLSLCVCLKFLYHLWVFLLSCMEVSTIIRTSFHTLNIRVLDFVAPAHGTAIMESEHQTLLWTSLSEITWQQNGLFVLKNLSYLTTVLKKQRRLLEENRTGVPAHLMEEASNSFNVKKSCIQSLIYLTSKCLQWF